MAHFSYQFSLPASTGHALRALRPIPLSGAMMEISSRLNRYRQQGIFLMLAATWAWLHFLMPIVFISIYRFLKRGAMGQGWRWYYYSRRHFSSRLFVLFRRLGLIKIPVADYDDGYFPVNWSSSRKQNGSRRQSLSRSRYCSDFLISCCFQSRRHVFIYILMPLFLPIDVTRPLILLYGGRITAHAKCFVVRWLFIDEWLPMKNDRDVFRQLLESSARRSTLGDDGHIRLVPFLESFLFYASVCQGIFPIFFRH